jgi:hypothetical protein
MNHRSAERVAALLRARYPGSDVDVTRQPGGLRIEVCGEGSSMFAVIGDEQSAVLAALEACPPTPHCEHVE